MRAGPDRIDHRRRAFLGALAVGVMAFEVGGHAVLLTPNEARAQGATFKILTPAEAKTLEALGECLVPGAAAAGIAHYIDANLTRGVDSSLLMLRYLDVPSPHADFYREGLAALDAASRRMHGAPFANLSAARAEALIKAISAANPDGWQGPPAPLFYFAARADAVDIVYGTMAGFEKLRVPYVGHIDPPTPY